MSHFTTKDYVRRVRAAGTQSFRRGWSASVTRTKNLTNLSHFLSTDPRVEQVLFDMLIVIIFKSVGIRGVNSYFEQSRVRLLQSSTV